jgi:hypothetical protein
MHKGIDEHRFSLFVCHRRWGKTVGLVNQLAKGALTCKRERPRFAYIAPLYKQAKQIAWDYLRHYTEPIPGRKVYESELRVELPNESRIQLFGADNPDALRGIYLDGVVLDEYGQMSPRLWPEIVLPTLADREGWGTLIGTPLGHNDFYAKYNHAKADPEWFCRLYRASETGIIHENELRRQRSQMSEEQYAQEYECDFNVGTPGAYYARLVNQADEDGRVKPNVMAEPGLPTFTAWDLGIGDSTAIWWAQVHHNEIRLIDYYAASGEPLTHFIQVVKERGQERGLTYEAHLAPHDIEVREFTSGVSRLETAQNMGVHFEVVPRLSVQDGIEAVRNMIPRCWFDRDRCADGISALRSYRKDVRQPATKDQPAEYALRPLHDWSSHGADAFRYLAVGMRPGRFIADDLSGFAERASAEFV